MAVEVTNETPESVHIKTETNSKGTNVEVSVIAASVDRAMDLWREANSKIKAEIGQSA